MPKILSGPYGSLIHDKLTKQGAGPHERKAITEPTAILHKPRTQMMVKEIAHAYLLGGADVLTTNTFSAREVLKGRQKDLYPYVIREHINILQKTIVDQSELAVSFGPYGDCYKPEEAPQSLREGTDFWHAAVEPLLSVSGKLDYALAETVNNGEEAIAIAHALKTLHRLTRGKVQGVMSFIPQKDGVRLLSGERIADVIATLHAELGSL